jgi:hypothetical protein
MAIENVRTFPDFVKQFPADGVATVRFTAKAHDEHIDMDVKLPGGKYLTFVQNLRGRSHETVKRTADYMINQLDVAGKRHNPVVDGTPVAAVPVS